MGDQEAQSVVCPNGIWKVLVLSPGLASAIIPFPDTE